MSAAGHDSGRLPPPPPGSGAHAPQEPGTPSAPPRRSRRAELTPLQRALGLLARREHSRKELVRKLVARGLETGEVEAAVDRLAGEGWQDDARFAESLVRSRASAGHGPLRIRAELGIHGLDRDTIAAAMAGFDGDWAGNARELVRRRFGTGLERDRSRQRKAADFLVRRGFTADHIRAAVRLEMDEEA